ncbi:ATP-dependent protease [Rugosibacter aromaticivorans]|uniref:ATP-dependent protease n=1 Tax=Rugosibacter aromaticivorans TaxID=1565605 RepID=A0A0C5JBM4_9PROT|nr:YifB family Mg chelatase-like AAA ATPase [Rugosibacter aromaticivorans]AJP49124.1 ATP-dependent protease [Rugosibacter aromaticivorans]
MALAVLRSRALAGLSAPEVTVEVHLTGGLPAFTLVGLPDTEVKEARDRVRAAIQNCGFEFPQRRITVNLAPADLPKESGRFDLPIALGVLIASGQLKAPTLDDYEFAGELALSGELRAIRGALAMCATMQRDATARRAFILPTDSAPEAALIADMTILPAKNLLQVCAHLSGRETIASRAVSPAPTFAHYPDLAEVKGQAPAKRALEVAAAGGHSLLMSGPPGAGKSMLAQRLPGLLPPMTDDEALAAAAVHSLAGLFKLEHWGQRAFRAPHHSASTAALVGGGSVPRPGEISLAHNGTLFLDELPEFQRGVLEALREPLETGHIHIARAARRAEFPARFQLIAAMNPCPCGYLGHPSGKCRCTPDQVARYRGKLSGPLLDRIDLMVDVPAISEAELSSRAAGETSAIVRARVMDARDWQLQRQGKPNAQLTPDEIAKFATPDVAGAKLLAQAMAQLSLSARGYHRILKVARSIADLASAPAINAAHIAEAIHYRRGLSG